MNEEEKNAVEYLKTRLYGNESCKYIDVAQEDLRIFINLIDSLQKENESWKSYSEKLEEEQIEENNKNCELEFEVEELQKENEKLKNIRYDTPYGTKTIHLIPESDLIEINTQKYMIEVEPGKFVDLKQVYLENKELKSRIPSLENGTYTGDIEGLLKLEKEIVKKDNEIKQLKEEVSQYKKIKEISENITLEDVEKAAKNYEKDYILREKVKEIAHELYYNNYKVNLDDGKFAQEMAEELEKALREEQEETMK